jgi:hypothetical protein
VGQLLSLTAGPVWYNFGRIHQTLRVPPAMEAGVTDDVWSVGEIVALIGGEMNWNEVVQKVTPQLAQRGRGTRKRARTSARRRV